MQKTQTLTRLQTDAVFHLRQLWFYNLGIHYTAEKQGCECCWLEVAVKRGSRETCSCVLKFLPQNCSAFVLLSDSCGGQIETGTSCVF